MTARATIGVRRIATGDGPNLRALRLASIADSPGAFTTTLRTAEARTEEQWESVAAAHAISDDQATWFAESDGAQVGMISAFLTADNVVTMSALWAAPGFRRLGVAELLVAVVREWAIGVGGRELRQWLVARNEHALAFHRGLGFGPTGEERAYEPEPSLREIELTLLLPTEV